MEDLDDLLLGDLFELKDLSQVQIKNKSLHLGVSCEVIFQDELQERVEKYMNKKLSKDGKLDMDKIFHENNIQKTNNLEQTKKKILISEINETSICGFAHAESNIEHLKELNFEKNFIVESPQEVVQFNKVYNSKSILLKAFHNDNQGDQLAKNESLFSFIDTVLEKEKIDEKVQIGLDCGFKFALTMIKEIKNLNQDSLIKSLEFIHSTLKMATPGSLYGIDRMSFMIDANMNEARAFTLQTLNDYVKKDNRGKSGDRVVELALKIIMLMGVARSNVEDLLMVPNLIDFHGLTVDLREEVQILCRSSSSKKEESKKRFSDMKVLKTVPIFYFKSGPYKADPIKLTYESAFACDGNFIYIHDKKRGLLKLGTGVGGSTYAQVYLQNAAYRKDENVTLMAHNGKLYCRSEQEKTQPFVILNPISLEEDKDLEESKEHILLWEKNKFTGRTIEKTPMISDGVHIYVLVQREKPKLVPKADTRKYETHPIFYVLECYDVSNNQFTLVKETTLYKDKNGEPFLDFKMNQSFATNGQLFYYKEQTKGFVFDIETGVMVEDIALGDEYSGKKFVYDNENNVFYQFYIDNNKYQRLETMKILNFRKQAQPKRFVDFITSQKEKISSQIKPDDSNQSSSAQPASMIQKLVKRVNADPAESLKHLANPISEETSKQIRTYILSLISSACNECNDKQEEMRFYDFNSADYQQQLIRLFKFPKATLLSTILFESLEESLLFYIEKLRNTKKSEKNLLDQYSLYFVLSILNCNFQAMVQCNIALPDILDEQPYQKFIAMYKNQFTQLISSSSSSEVEVEEGESKEEIQCLWSQIHAVCLEVNAISINFFYSNTKEIVQRIEQVIKEIESHPSEADNICVLMNHLSKVENAKSLFQQDFETIKLVQNIYEECCKIKTKYITNYIKSNTFESVAHFKEPQSNLVVECGKFLKVVNEQLTYAFIAFIEAHNPSEAQTHKLHVFQSMILKSFEISCTELSCYINEMTNMIYGQLSGTTEAGTAKDSAWFKGISDIYYRYSNIMKSLFVNESGFYYVVSLLLQQFSLLETNMHILPKVISSVKELLFEIDYYYKTMLKFKSSFEICEEKDILKSSIDQFTRRLCHFIGLTSYKLVQIPKKVEKKEESDEQPTQKDEAELIEEMIINSNLLSGGIENKYLSVFSEKSLHEIKTLASIAHDDQIEVQRKVNFLEDREFQTLFNIINEGNNLFIDKLLVYLQKQLEKKSNIFLFILSPHGDVCSTWRNQRTQTVQSCIRTHIEVL